MADSKAPSLLMVEGTFFDQADELAQYIDNLSQSSLSTQLAPLIESEDKEEIVNKLVEASPALSGAPEKEFIPSYNLLVHLVRQSNSLPQFIPTILKNLSTPPAASPNNGPSLLLSILTTLFNILSPHSPLRASVFKTTLQVVSTHGLYDLLSPQLKNLARWLAEWNSSDDEARKILVTVADIAEAAGDNDQFYNSLLQALQRYTPHQPTDPGTRALAVRLVKAAISVPNRLEFEDLTALDSIQALAKSDPELFNLLEVYAGGDLEDYEEFNDVHEGWLEENGIDHGQAVRKIRLLTLASLAAGTPGRALPYRTISKALHIPSEDVEMWVIDVIRAGLVEGKLSQLNQTFLIHRATYRLFGLDQWIEIGDRLETWKATVSNILEVVKAARESIDTQNVREQAAADQALEGEGNQQRERGGRRGPQAIEVRNG